MSAQTRYGYFPPKGHPGGIVDLAPYAVDTFLNEEATGVMKFGMGVVRGTKPGHNINVPADGATADLFEGITTNNRTTEFTMDGELFIRHGAPVGVMRYGRIYGRVAADATPAYGEPVYMIVTGEEAGYFTNAADGNVAIKARFLSGVDAATNAAMIELFDQAQV